MNLGRLSALAAGLPVTVAGQTIYRQCASGLLAISIAAYQIVQEGMDVVIAAGQENFSALQARYFDWAVTRSAGSRPSLSTQCLPAARFSNSWRMPNEQTK